MANAEDLINRKDIITIVENTVYKMLEQFFDKKFKDLQNYLDFKLNSFKQDDELHRVGCKAFNMWDKNTCEDFYQVKSEIKKHIEIHKAHEIEEEKKLIKQDKLSDKTLTNKRIIYSLIFTPIIGLGIKGVYDFIYWLLHR